MRSEQEKLAREESIAFESRYIRWAANFGVESDPEEFLLNANLFLASDMDRVRGAYLELTQSQVDGADNAEIKEASDTGNRLFSDPRGVPVAMYGARRFNGMKPGGPSWGSAKAPALDPGELMGKLESSAMGCYWILDVLEELLKLARESFWVGGDRLRMIRLLGRNPVDAIADRRVAEVFAASHAASAWWKVGGICRAGSRCRASSQPRTWRRRSGRGGATFRAKVRRRRPGRA